MDRVRQDVQDTVGFSIDTIVGANIYRKYCWFQGICRGDFVFLGCFEVEIKSCMMIFYGYIVHSIVYKTLMSFIDTLPWANISSLIDYF